MFQCIYIIIWFQFTPYREKELQIATCHILQPLVLDDANLLLISPHYFLRSSILCLIFRQILPVLYCLCQTLHHIWTEDYSVYISVIFFIRLCKLRRADHRASPFCNGGDVQDPQRSEPHQRPPQAAALRLHWQ